MTWATVNTATQALTTTPSALNILGSVITGCECRIDGNSINPRGGIYHAHANAQLTVNTGGTVLMAWYRNGVEIPESRRAVTVSAGVSSLDSDFTRRIEACRVVPADLQVYAWLTGSADVDVSQLATDGNKVG